MQSVDRNKCIGVFKDAFEINFKKEQVETHERANRFNCMFNAFCTNRLTSILYAPRSTGRKHWADSSAQSCSNDKIGPDRSQAHSHMLINTTLLLNVFNPCMDDVSAWTSEEPLLLKCNYGSLQ